MPATTSKFPQLPRELRDMIWQATANAQFRQIADGQPTSCKSQNTYAERLRQAYVGYDSLPEGTEKQPLRLYVHDYGDRLKLSMNEFRTFVNTFTMATVCTEARSQIEIFCRAQIWLVDLFCYYPNASPDHPKHLEQEISDPVFTTPMTVMITNSYDKDKGPEAFKSAVHLVDILRRVFSNGVERIILCGWFLSFRSMEELYWPNTAQLEALRYMRIETSEQHEDKSALFMTQMRNAYSTNQLLDPKGFNKRYVTWNLLKLQEITDASANTLPRLQSIEVEHYTYSWDQVMPTRIKATKHDDGTLWVDWSDVKTQFHHRFAGFNGYPPEN